MMLLVGMVSRLPVWTEFNVEFVARKVLVTAASCSNASPGDDCHGEIQ